MLPLEEYELPRGGPGPDDRSPAARQALQVLGELLADRRDQLVHDAWTLRSLFGSARGPWRRAGFATRVLVRAATAEMERMGTLHADPLDEAFWLLSEQQRYLNHDVVDERVVRTLWRERDRLRPSQQRAAVRLLQLRGHNLTHPRGSPASNLLLLAALAGGMSAAEGSESLRTAIAGRFPAGLPFVARDEADCLLLPQEARRRLDERALALDLAYRTGQLH
ncbi:hypothetical protein [Vulgatibacter sp.]|uniref:hypothetical protein n=1 Tax=Vulgatibacter sp. TaxID=1971226 RepID=UPI003565AC0B